MASITLTLTGDTSSLNSYFCPEIELDERYNYSCCLLDFYSFNSIPNLNETNNRLSYSNDGGGTFEEMILPVGSYEISGILDLLAIQFQASKTEIEITVNTSTMKSTIHLGTNCMVDFGAEFSIGPMLGFVTDSYFGPNSHHVSNKVINIQSINNLRIDCDLISGSYHNGMSTHTIHEFDPSVDPGYKIAEQPKHLIYLPVNRHRISSINISIFDQAGKLVDFRGETITCRIHIKRDV